MMNRHESIYGLKKTPPKQTTLKAGPFTMIYEKGFIRQIRYGRHEVLRMIYMALRDKDWGTFTPQISNEQIMVYERSFHIRYTCQYLKKGSVIFEWKAEIEGEESGRVTFFIDGKAFSDLLKNRAGFCILHPIEDTAGEPVTVTGHNGDSVTASFPRFIAPQDPFCDIIKMKWLNNGNAYILEMDGDIFEMEDQRNWTDASFKTFCTPLAIPYPVKLRKGDMIRQQVRFSPEIPLPDPHSLMNDDEIRIEVDYHSHERLPLFGIGASTEMMYLHNSAVHALRKMSFGLYFFELKTSEVDWQSVLLNELEEAKRLSLPLCVSLELDSNDNLSKEFAAFARAIGPDKELLKYLLLLSREHPTTEQSLIDWAADHIRSVFPATLLGMGTATNFAELNRNRRNAAGMDFISYAIHPQEHAFDHLSLVENLAAQHDSIVSAREIYPKKKICILPLTLKKRLNPYATDKRNRVLTNARKTDPRQRSLWFAGWMLGSIKYLSEAGTSSIGFCQTAGRQGICGIDGDPYPVACLLECMNELAGAEVFRSRATKPLECSSLLLQKEDKYYLLLANHTDKPLTVVLPFRANASMDIETDPSRVERSMLKQHERIELAPYGVAMIF